MSWCWACGCRRVTSVAHRAPGAPAAPLTWGAKARSAQRLGTSCTSGRAPAYVHEQEQLWRDSSRQALCPGPIHKHALKNQRRTFLSPTYYPQTLHLRAPCPCCRQKRPPTSTCPSRCCAPPVLNHRRLVSWSWSPSLCRHRPRGPPVRAAGQGQHPRARIRRAERAADQPRGAGVGPPPRPAPARRTVRQRRTGRESYALPYNGITPSFQPRRTPWSLSEGVPLNWQSVGASGRERHMLAGISSIHAASA